MDIGKTLYLTDRKEWRLWLSKNYAQQKDIWLIFYKKASGKPRISYDDAVEEALCYGWIDSIVKKLDEDSFVQRFSPRKSTSNLSQPNVERVRKMIRQKKMTKAGLSAIAHAYNPAFDTEELKIPQDILIPFKTNTVAWKNFSAFPKEYQRIRLAFVESRRRHGATLFKKSLDHLIEMSQKNKQFGFVKV